VLSSDYEDNAINDELEDQYEVNEADNSEASDNSDGSSVIDFC
jgi:hypothetical protein